MLRTRKAPLYHLAALKTFELLGMPFLLHPSNQAPRELHAAGPEDSGPGKTVRDADCTETLDSQQPLHDSSCAAGLVLQAKNLAVAGCIAHRAASYIHPPDVLRAHAKPSSCLRRQRLGERAHYETAFLRHGGLGSC